MTDGAADMLAILREARSLLMRPECDFAWSSWEGPEDAVAEIDGFIEAIGEGRADLNALQVLFAATGPIQEVSLSSGWAQEFVDLAERFDAAVRKID